MRKILLISVPILTAMTAVWACGPYFPESLVWQGDAAVLAIPRADFTVETRRLAPAKSRHSAVVSAPRDHAQKNIEAEIADLQQALRARPAPEREALCAAYTQFRVLLEKADGSADVPTGLPTEFALYAHGLQAYRADKGDEARQHWEQLLALPAEQRRYRSTWAAYMIGRSLVKSDPQRALMRFTRLLELVDEGYPDPLGLAAASIGWSAQAHLSMRQYSQAIALYLRQQAAGDPTAVASLQITCERIFASAATDPTLLDALAGDEQSRSVLTAYSIARGGPFRPAPADAQLKAWLSAIERAGARDARGADRLAWMAYQAGEMEAAQRWCARAAADAPVAQWVRAKLLLREGRTAEAASVLATVVKLFPVDEQWPQSGECDEGMLPPFSPHDRAGGELALLRLTRGQYVDALDLLLRHGYWTDASYVAERVMTADELQVYVDRRWSVNPTPELASDGSATWGGDGLKKQIPAAIRLLLARRLTRAGRWKEAGAYFPPSMQPKLDAYIAGIREGHDARRPAAERAAALWRSAQIARADGMELLGTELGPDYAIYGGSFGDEKPMTARRNAQQTANLIPTSPEEKQRVAQHAPQPDLRFHYRYTAADHAWAAAALMPDNDEQTARVLCIAGGWLKDRDAPAADRFYKELVRRCPETTLGREAAALRWFPKAPVH